MPKVPEYNLKPLKSIYAPKEGGVGQASMKQKNYIITLCERRKLPKPDFTNMTKGQAAQIISQMTNA